MGGHHLMAFEGDISDRRPVGQPSLGIVCASVGISDCENLLDIAFIWIDATNAVRQPVKRTVA
jgi:hypothetical protein